MIFHLIMFPVLEVQACSVSTYHVYQLQVFYCIFLLYLPAWSHSVYVLLSGVCVNNENLRRVLVTKVVIKSSVISGTSWSLNFSCFNPVSVNCVKYFGFGGCTFPFHVLFGTLRFIVVYLLSDLELIDIHLE